MFLTSFRETLQGLEREDLLALWKMATIQPTGVLWLWFNGKGIDKCGFPGSPNDIIDSITGPLGDS